jgi:hypothetical protein
MALGLVGRRGVRIGIFLLLYVYVLLKDRVLLIDGMNFVSRKDAKTQRIVV